MPISLYLGDQQIGGGGYQVSDIQQLTASGTWNKPAAGDLVCAYMTSGGSSGNGGNFVFHCFDMNDLSESEAATVGAGAIIGGDSSFHGVSTSWAGDSTVDRDGFMALLPGAEMFSRGGRANTGAASPYGGGAGGYNQDTRPGSAGLFGGSGGAGKNSQGYNGAPGNAPGGGGGNGSPGARGQVIIVTYTKA